MRDIPIVYPIFNPFDLPESEVTPSRYKYFLYNTILFVEHSDIIVCTNSLYVKNFVETSMPTFLKKNLYCEYFKHQECKDLFRELYELPAFNTTMAVVMVVSKMTPFFKLGLKEYFHLDMDALVVNNFSVNSFGRSGALLSFPHILEHRPNPEIHEYLKKILKKRTSMEVLDDHRDIPWFNAGVYRISPYILKDFLKEEILPLYSYHLQEFHQDLLQGPLINIGDELIFRILLLFLKDKDVCKESLLYNYMPHCLKGIPYDLPQAKIIHYSGPIKRYLHEQRVGLRRPLPSELYHGEPQMDDKIDSIYDFYFERRKYINDILFKKGGRQLLPQTPPLD